LIVVMGPSGSGKDTLMSHARAALAAEHKVLFVRRAITGQPTPVPKTICP
jgi:ribose 1,5-bisphosphokinase